MLSLEIIYNKCSFCYSRNKLNIWSFISSKNKINIVKVDIDKFQDLTLKHRIMSVPTLMFFKDGVKQEEVIGFHSEDELLEIIEKL